MCFVAKASTAHVYYVSINGRLNVYHNYSNIKHIDDGQWTMDDHRRAPSALISVWIYWQNAFNKKVLEDYNPFGLARRKKKHSTVEWYGVSLAFIQRVNACVFFMCANINFMKHLMPFHLNIYINYTQWPRLFVPKHSPTHNIPINPSCCCTSHSMFFHCLLCF